MTQPPDDAALVARLLAADEEVAKIMAMSDEQVLAEAAPEDLAWAAAFKATLQFRAALEPSDKGVGR